MDIEIESKLNILRLTRAALASLLIGLFPVFAIGVVQGFRVGFLTRDSLLLAVGAVASFSCAFAYSCVGLARANGSGKRTWMFFAITSGILPYLFIMYLLFYRGAWALVRLFSAFSWRALFGALTFTLIGFYSLRHLQTVTDIVRSVPEAVDTSREPKEVGRGWVIAASLMVLALFLAVIMGIVWLLGLIHLPEPFLSFVCSILVGILVFSCAIKLLMGHFPHPAIAATCD